MYIHESIFTEEELEIIPFFPNEIRKEDVLFFDIETTGFQADATTMYLLGCLFLKEGHWQLVQYFADDNKSEEQILTAFFSLAQNFRYLFHYNGNSFDLPYMHKRCKKFHLPYQIPEEKSFDLYRRIAPFRTLLALPDLKQKTLEQYLGIKRKDIYSGGDLIPLYGQYIKAKYAHLPEEEDLRNTFLLHNKEDLLGLLMITRVLAFPALFSSCLVSDLTINKDTLTAQFFLELSHPLPKPVAFQAEEFALQADIHNATLSIRIYQAELKYFYPDYKDYYYLPEEDMAIHKSVASYVEKEFRQKAKASNCYIRHSGYFLPQPGEMLKPFFKENYQQKCSFIELSEDFCKDKNMQTGYVRNLLCQAQPCGSFVV